MKKSTKREKILPIKGYKSYDNYFSYIFHISSHCLLVAEVSEIHVYFQ